MIKRRGVLHTIGVSGVASLSGCTGSSDGTESEDDTAQKSYPTGGGTIELDDQSLSGGIAEDTRRKNDFLVNVPEDDWAQIHLNLSHYATITVAAIARAGSATIFVIPRDEWENYIEPKTGWKGISLNVSAYADEEQAESLGVNVNPKYSISVENFESDGEFEALLSVAESVDSSHSYRQEDIVIENSKVYDE